MKCYQKRGKIIDICLFPKLISPGIVETRNKIRKENSYHKKKNMRICGCLCLVISTAGHKILTNLLNILTTYLSNIKPATTQLCKWELCLCNEVFVFHVRSCGASFSVHSKEALLYLWVSICSLLNMQLCLCWNWRVLCAQALRLSNRANINQHVHTCTHTQMAVMASSIAKIHRNQTVYSLYVVFLICWLGWLNPPRSCSN